MSGIYIHIPFCKKKCTYCDFHVSTLLKNKKKVIDSISKEIYIRKDKNYKVDTIYFGGGTPSILSEKELFLLIDSIYNSYDVSDNIEFTIEVNPDDVSKKNLEILKRTRINRISLGIQSFFDRDLQFMGRTHNSRQNEYAIKLFQDFGYKNISVDFIYGLPEQTMKEWEYSLDKIINMDIPHISAYALTVEEKTFLDHCIKNKKIKILEENYLQFYRYLRDVLKSNNFILYEISNFSKNGFISKHNSSYWNYEPYIGIGPSAHSFDGNRVRRWNISNNSIYSKKIDLGEIFFKEEILTDRDRYNEYVMTRMRTIEGIDTNYLKNEYPQYFKYFKDISEKLINDNKIYVDDNKIQVKEESLFFINDIISDLFIL